MESFCNLDEEAPMLESPLMDNEDQDKKKEEEGLMQIGLPINGYLEHIETLQNEVNLAEQTNGCDIVAFYFSAHWCRPCTVFTPKLNEFYKSVNANGKKIEIIFISSDNDEIIFNEYFESMEWNCAVKYEHGEIRSRIK
jgi:thiol-disulfide isomerase/thioredoxin